MTQTYLMTEINFILMSEINFICVNFVVLFLFNKGNGCGLDTSVTP